MHSQAIGTTGGGKYFVNCGVFSFLSKQMRNPSYYTGLQDSLKICGHEKHGYEFICILLTSLKISSSYICIHSKHRDCFFSKVVLTLWDQGPSQRQQCTQEITSHQVSAKIYFECVQKTEPLHYLLKQVFLMTDGGSKH